MRCDVAAVRILLVFLCGLTPAVGSAQAQRSGAPERAKSAVAYDSLIGGMSCRQQASGRMDCEFRVGSGTRFVVAGVGQEDVFISFLQADTSADYVASIAPLHGCVIVKPTRAAEAAVRAGSVAGDSISTYAFVSPRTGKVYRNWQGCLVATRREPSRAGGVDDSTMRATEDSIMNAAALRIAKKADSLARARAAANPPPRKPR